MNYLGISFISSATLAYEVILIRIFSIALWYHFAFMVASIAMLGIAVSGTFVSIFPQAKRHERLGRYAIFLSLAIIFSYIAANYIPFEPPRIAWDRKQIFYIALYYLFLGMPFFFSGIIVLTAIGHMAEKAGRIYFFDLIGAAVGSISILFILSLTDEKGSVVIIFLLSMFGGFLFSINEKRRGLTWIFIAVIAIPVIAVYAYKPSVFDIKISPYKGMMTALRFPGATHIETFNSPYSRVDLVKSPAVRYAPGLSFRYMKDLPEQIGIAVDGGELNAVTKWSKNMEKLKFIEYLPSAIPYVIGKNDDVFILEPKGGLSIITAVYYSSRNIDKVEGNPIIIKAINKGLMDFSGGIFKDNTYAGLGRAWIKKKGLYDIIDINLTGLMPGGGGSYGLMEDFKLTKEAFVDYIEHLKGSGYISMTLYLLPPARMELKIISTLISAMEDKGINESHKHIAVIRSWNTVTILAKKDRLSIDDIEGIKRFSRERRFDTVYYPGILPEEANIYNKLPDNSYFEVISRIVNPEQRSNVIKDYLFEISPVTDEMPFVYYFLKLKNIFEIYRLAGSKWEYLLEEGYLVPIILIQAVVISLALIILPLIAKKTGNGIVRLKVLVYFLSLGLGFMLLEVSIIQRFILYLDNPIYAAAIVIMTILLSSGIGSLVSQRLNIDNRLTGLVVLMPALIALFYAIYLKDVISLTLGFNFYYRVFISIILLIPIGFFMGMPFPIGIRYIAKKGEGLIPWAWGINGSFSVIGSVLSAMLALWIGFSGVMYAASILYASAFLSIWLSPSPRP